MGCYCHRGMGAYESGITVFILIRKREEGRYHTKREYEWGRC
jgi:hypothetical protein